MQNFKRRITVLVMATALTLLHFSAPASADDGICGGIGTFDPATGQCV